MVQTGEMRTIFAKSLRTAMTRPPVDVDPMLTIKVSPLANLVTYLGGLCLVSKGEKKEKF